MSPFLEASMLISEIIVGKKQNPVTEAKRYRNDYSATLR